MNALRLARTRRGLGLGFISGRTEARSQPVRGIEIERPTDPRRLFFGAASAPQVNSRSTRFYHKTCCQPEAPSQRRREAGELHVREPALISGRCAGLQLPFGSSRRQ